jgi:RNA polymerase sigma-70 factor, ECF subfamily
MSLEEEIGELLRAEDWEGATTLAVKQLGPRIVVYLRSVLRDDELTHETFSRFCEKLWRGIRDFRGESSFETWAYRVAWYASKEQRRILVRRREVRLATDAVSQIVQEVWSRTSPAFKTETKDRWAKLKESLADDERSLLLLRVDRALSWREIAAIMAEEGEPMAEAAWRKRFERLREKIHKLAKEQGLRE